MLLREIPPPKMMADWKTQSTMRMKNFPKTGGDSHPVQGGGALTCGREPWGEFPTNGHFLSFSVCLIKVVLLVKVWDT